MNNTSLNINDLKQLSQLMEESDVKIELPIPQIQKLPKKVTIQSPQVSDSSDQPTIKKPRGPQMQKQQIAPQMQKQQIAQVSEDISNASPNFELMGYVINKQTVYLLIVLIVIGIGIWFMTNQKNDTESELKQKKIKKDELEEDEQNEDN